MSDAIHKCCLLFFYFANKTNKILNENRFSFINCEYHTTQHFSTNFFSFALLETTLVHTFAFDYYYQHRDVVVTVRFANMLCKFVKQK